MSAAFAARAVMCACKLPWHFTSIQIDWPWRVSYSACRMQPGIGSDDVESLDVEAPTR